jgi:hypothetical protein
MEPFLAIGEMLSAEGHTISYAFPAQFEKLVPAGYPFHPLDRSFIELLESREGKAIMGGSGNPLMRIIHLWRLYKKGMRVNHRLTKDQYAIVREINPDRIIHHPKCNYPVIWSMLTGKPAILVSPVPYFLHTDPEHPHIGINIRGGKAFNKFSYRLANTGLINTISGSQKQLPETMAIANRP